MRPNTNEWSGPKLVGVAESPDGLCHQGAVWSKDNRDYLGPLCRAEIRLSTLGFASVVTCIQCAGSRVR